MLKVLSYVYTVDCNISHLLDGLRYVDPIHVKFNGHHYYTGLKNDILNEPTVFSHESRPKVGTLRSYPYFNILQHYITTKMKHSEKMFKRLLMQRALRSNCSLQTTILRSQNYVGAATNIVVTCLM
jgi:hypothetical protein